METTRPLKQAARCGGNGRVTLPAILMLSAFAGTCTQAAGQSQPIAPQVQVQSVHEIAEEKLMVPWKPGDPVRVVPDLRESEESPAKTEEGQKAQIEMQPSRPLKPIVRQPVTPQVMDENVEGLPAPNRYEEDDPVRIVPDLKESDTEN
jgi:hypothetical protein